MEYGYANAPEEMKPAIRQHIQEMRADLELLPLSEHLDAEFQDYAKRYPAYEFATDTMGLVFRLEQRRLGEKV